MTPWTQGTCFQGRGRSKLGPELWKRAGKAAKAEDMDKRSGPQTALSGGCVKPQRKDAKGGMLKQAQQHHKREKPGGKRGLTEFEIGGQEKT